jgi:hypothetical protein
MWKYYQFTKREEHEKILQKQENWRQKQLDIFYRTGKPIFTMTMENMHIRNNNNPHFYVDKRRL